MEGFGTYEEGGTIYSSAIGCLQLDERNKVARVRLDNPPAMLRRGDRVFCQVTEVRPAMVVCNVVAIEGTRRAVAGETMATIHVSKISSRYTEDASEEYRPTDLVRAEVVQWKPSVQLTTARADLGVILARCRSCREPLERQGSKLFCHSCDRTEHRKLAKDYRDVKL